MKTHRRLFHITGPIMLLCTAILTVLWGCGDRKTSPDIQVCVSIPPQVFFVDKIGGKQVSCHVMVNPGQTPHTFSPTPKQISQVLNSSLYFTVGLPFEQRLVEKISEQKDGPRVVDTCEGIKFRRTAPQHPHDNHHEHEHAGQHDPHTWLDPNLAAVQARHICNALKSADPENADIYEKNFNDLASALQKLDSDIREILAPFHGRAIFVFHPAFGYFTDAYDLEQISIEVEGKPPGPKQLSKLIAVIQDENAGVIFVEPQYSHKSARAIADAAGAELVTIDPLSKDYMQNLRSIAEAIRDGLDS